MIMAGGRGERFWPVSREKSPKQLIKLLGNQSLLQQTVDRVLKLAPLENILIITNHAQVAGVRKQLPGLPRENVIAEPCGRDTCAAIVLGAAIIDQRNPKGVMAVFPADHHIQDQRTFQRILKDCFDLASSNEYLVTIGISPTEPATGYGYIRKGPILKSDDRSRDLKTRFSKVDLFVEKPPIAKARRYLKSGKYSWNAGMFVWSVRTFMISLKKYQPDLEDYFLKWKSAAASSSKLSTQLKKDYPSVKRISIDYALMEKAENTVVADGVFDWDDLGSWTALERYLKSDKQGNHSNAQFAQIDSNDNIVFDARSKKQHLIALVGVRDCIVVQTDDSCLVASKAHGQHIKELVKILAKDPKFKGLV